MSENLANKKYETIVMQDPKKPRSLEMWVLTEEFHNFKATSSWIHQVEMAHKIVDVETQKVLKDKIPVPKSRKSVTEIKVED